MARTGHLAVSRPLPLLLTVLVVLVVVASGCVAVKWASPAPGGGERAPIHILVTDPENAEGDPDVAGAVRAAERRETLSRTFTWTHAGQPFHLDARLDRGLYEAYRDRSRSFNVHAYAQFALHPGDDATLAALARDVAAAARDAGIPEREVPDVLLAFVQSLTYERDESTAGVEDYPRFPLETLVEGRGDCEDLSILYVSLLDALGYRAALVLFPGHMGAGVALEEAPGWTVEHDGVRYAYAEPSTPGWLVGEVPEEYQDAMRLVLPVQDVAVPEVSWRVTREGNAYAVEVTVHNNGTRSGEDLMLWIGLESVPGGAWSESRFPLPWVPPGGDGPWTVVLRGPTTAPGAAELRLRAVLSGPSGLLDERVMPLSA